MPSRKANSKPGQRGVALLRLVRPEDDADYEPVPSEKEALAVGLALVSAEWTGEDDFSKGMRALQGVIRERPNAKLRDAGESGVEQH